MTSTEQRAEFADDIISTEIKDNAIKTKRYFIYPSQLRADIDTIMAEIEGA